MSFQKVCRSRCHRVSTDQSAQLERIHPGSWADTTILTPVPRCAGECRFVRVARVLDASWTRTCVALVLAAAARPAAAPAPRTRPCHTGTRARPRLNTIDLGGFSLAWLRDLACCAAVEAERDSW